MTALERLLRDPEAIIVQCLEDRDLRGLVQICLVAILIGGAVFGAAVGSLRGGWQIGAAALKIPLATVVALGFCAPAVHGLALAFERPWTFRAVLALALAAAARAGLVQLALAPVLWLAVDLGAAYHGVKLLAAMAFGLSGLSALGLVVRALGPAPGRASAALAFVGLFLLVGGQSGWVLRPYLGDPRDSQVPFLVLDRKEGGLVGALSRSSAALLGGADDSSRAWERR